MKLRKALAGILGAVVMLLGVGTFEHINEHKEVWAAETTNFNFKTLTSNTDKAELNKAYKSNKITFEGNKGSNSNVPKYYTKGEAGRFYGGNYFTIKADDGYKITTINLTYGSSDGSNSITTDCGSFASPKWTGSSQTVKFTISGTSGNRRIKSIDVTYESGAAVELEKLNAPKIEVVDDQTGLVTWGAVANASGYSYTINGANEEKVYTPTNVTLAVGETLAVRALGDDKTYGNSEYSSYKYELPTNLVVKGLLEDYYFDGVYIRDTVIYLNESAKEELQSCFHAKVNMLERTTYFEDKQLWMTNEIGSYSYYGTSEDGLHLTGGRVATLDDTTSSIALKNVGGMEGYYTTLTDIIELAPKATWTKSGSVYTSTDKALISAFLDFTAPCFLGIDDTNYNYFTLSGVSVQEDTTNRKLILKLLTSGDTGKITSSDKALSQATISRFVKKQVTDAVDALKLSFNNVAAKASGDDYIFNNYAAWTITGKLGQTYANYLGFGRSGDSNSAITSPEISLKQDLKVTAVLKGNGSSGVSTSTITFELLDSEGNVIATGGTVTPADAKDKTYSITFTYNPNKSYKDVSYFRMSFAKKTGNIGFKSLSANY